MLADCREVTSIRLLPLVGKGGPLSGTGSPTLGLPVKLGSMGWVSGPPRSSERHLCARLVITTTLIICKARWLNSLVAVILSNSKETFLQGTYTCRWGASEDQGPACPAVLFARFPWQPAYSFSFCPMPGWVFHFPILAFGFSKGWVCFQEPPSTTPSVHALLSHSPPAGWLANPGGEHRVAHPGRRQCRQNSTCFLSGIAILNELTHQERIDSYSTRQPLPANST